MQEPAHPTPPQVEQSLRTAAGQSDHAGPESAHQSRKTELEADAARLAASSQRISTFRLITLLGAIGIGFARGLNYLPPPTLWLAIALAVIFVALVIWHAKLDQNERRVAAGIDLHHWALERLTGEFHKYPSRGDRFLSDTHPYSSDLGIFGEGSAFQLLDSTHTRRGEEALARWLSEPSDARAARERQDSARDLAARDRFRESFAIEGALIAVDKPDPEPFLAWAEGARTVSTLPLVRPVAFALPGIQLIVLGLAIAERAPWSAWFVVLAVQWVTSMVLLPRIEPVAAAVGTRTGAFERYRAMLELIEGQTFEAARLRALFGELRPVQGERKASQQIRRLATIVSFLDARSNEAFRLFIGPALFWDLHCVLALEAWQNDAGKRARGWLDAIGQVEALSSLGAYAYDHPDFVFPTLSDEPAFRARGLGHPLLDPRSCVRNDVELRGAGTALLITGSNMSGKSTLLRAMGLAAVFAMAGAPIAATEFVVSPFEVRTSMWARDSLMRGVSHFYAELEKLRRVVDGLGSGRPLLFLLDEILQGTNSRERIIGARSVLRKLLQGGAMGAVSTHDLGLLELDADLDRRLDKVHFEEQVATLPSGSSTMSFDYRLRPGVVQSTNALRLMQLVGIDVELA